MSTEMFTIILLMIPSVIGLMFCITLLISKRVARWVGASDWVGWILVFGLVCTPMVSTAVVLILLWEGFCWLCRNTPSLKINLPHPRGFKH